MGKGWFKTEGRDGDRTLAQQMVGLDQMFDNVAGKSVLDVGCAEGLIALELAKQGAYPVVGIDIVPAHIAAANANAILGVEFMVGDAMSYEPAPTDVVLLLAILHKLKTPYAAAVRYAKAAKQICVVRLPPAGAVFRDARSGNQAIDVTAAMREGGLELTHETRGSFDEWIGWYIRQVDRPKQEAEQEAPPPSVTDAPASAPTVATSTDVSQLGVADEAGQAESAPAHAVGSQSTADDPAQFKREHPEHETAPPPESVHPGGDPAEQLPIENIEPLPLEGRSRRTRAKPDTE